MELGGSIVLENFENIDKGNLVVIKKIVGNYTKNIQNKYKDYKKIKLSLEPESRYKLKIVYISIIILY